MRVPVLQEPQLFLLLALLIGVFSGLAAVCFRIAIAFGRFWLLGSSMHPPANRLLLVLPVAGLVVAALVQLVFPAVRGSGVNQTKAAVYIYDGYIPFRTVIGKFLTSALAIGSGQSLGPEDPSLQVGAGLASAIGRLSGLSRDKLRLIAPLGAAAGLAAAFNSPITAVLFVIEEVIGTWSAVALGAIVLAAVSSAVVARWFLGDQPLFRVPEYHLAHTSELISYAILGLIGGFVALVFVKFAIFMRPRLRALPRWTWYLQPAVAGIIIAGIAIWFPQITGAGYEYVDEAMRDRYVWQVLAIIGGLKIFTTVLSFTSGTPGGLFAPTLFIGAMVGGAVCGATRSIFPWFDGSTGTFALIGMGTMFAGILRAPITSVFMIIEVSGNYSIALPVMISNTIAYLVSRKYQREGIFDVLSRQDGVVLPSMEEQRETSVHRVEDAMREEPVLVFTDVDTVSSALVRANAVPTERLLVRVRPGTWTSVPAQRLKDLEGEGKGALALGSVLALSAAIPPVFPDQSLDVALGLIGDQPFLPVVHRANPSRLVGVITVDQILNAYRHERT
ncbi:MAG TPA: chloride channel protein [Vicinamibacterales bacterium]|nr:chloride channel protein [Vicinamibacterales bacterium]